MTTTKYVNAPSGISTQWLELPTPGPSLHAQCSAGIYLMPGAAANFIALDPIYGDHIDTKVRCLATQQTQWWEQKIDGVPATIALGRFACPTGYTTVTRSPVNPETTFIGCCPSEYDFVGSTLPAGSPGQCKSALSTDQTVTAKASMASPTSWIDVTSIITTTGASVIGVHVNGYAFTDREIAAPTISTNPVDVPQSTSPNTAALGSSNSTSGLSNGAKIGIGVGVGLGALGAIALIAIALFLKRRSGRASSHIPLEIASPTNLTAQAPQERHRKDHPVDRWHNRVMSRDRRDSAEGLW